MGSAEMALAWGHRTASTHGEGARQRVEALPAETQHRGGASAQAETDDSAIAAACLAGDLHGYERLYRLQGARMRNLARNLLGSPSEAEDAVQETFLKVQRSVGSFRGQSSFVTWTFRILVNTCHDLRRSRMRRKELAQQEDAEDQDPLPNLRAPGAHPTLRMALERAIAKLTQHQRDVFLLYEVEGFRHAEIAGMLEITETASKNTLFQAKKSLRGMLEAPRSADAGGAA
jgi:RNA polymerase sigma-70 factor (ECF subfamily)